MKVSDIDLAYTAGLIDGEGSICLSTNKSPYRRPEVQVTSTTYELVLYLKSLYGGYISNHKIYKEHHKKSYHWKIINNDALNMLVLILPYLKEPIKIYRALLLINVYKSVTVRNGKYSDKQKSLKEKFEYDFFHPSIP